ncbi:putative regulatory protein, FmdB family [Dehalogenimonas formicexedens]|uniref:Putative regulatory protein, FmdB family n=1 Tax=Dehalogenimonas formicexedens TaxID=1839801 RepID=A0A1P8F4S4_9CHLR|nr:zinc ribbon domain-containing protein [Dehalogenimonas formicexedens]APV43476.1 putative regulatory protein, FmdB family [Dehalogenimonas formicexedens]
MPIYDYKCRACGHVTELLVSYTGKCQDFSCSSCGGTDLERQRSVPIVLSRCNPGGKTCCGAEDRSQVSGCGGGGCCGGH